MVLLDNQSTVDVFYNKDLLNNIREVETQMNIHCNAGVNTTNLAGDLPGYGTVWFYEDRIANILSLSSVKREHEVSFNSEKGNCFKVSRKNKTGKTLFFKQAKSGLYYANMRHVKNNVTLVTTTKEKMDGYTKKACERAELARHIQKTIGRPSTKDFLEIIEKGGIVNCPIDKSDILAAEDIFGSDIGSIKGKTTRRQMQNTAENNTLNNQPTNIADKYKNVTICIDLMFVNRIIFLISISQSIRFGTCELLVNQTHISIAKAIDNIIKLYSMGGFHVSRIHMDGQFKGIQEKIIGKTYG